MTEVLPVSAKASHTRWGWLYRSVGLTSPYATHNLLFGDAPRAWNSGRFAPVTLSLDFGRKRTMTGLMLTPEMEPLEGHVEVRVLINTWQIPHASIWQDAVPVVIEWEQPIEARSVTIEFLRSPSWIALRRASILEAKRQPTSYMAVAAVKAADALPPTIKQRHGR